MNETPTSPPKQTFTERTAFRIRLGKDRILNTDPAIVTLIAVTLFMVGMGLIMVLSASSITSYLGNQGFLGGFWRQFLFAALGIPLMFVAARIPLNFWKRAAWPIFGLGLGLAALVFTPLGIEVGGNRNWIEIGPISAQPSEPLKLALIVWMATVLHKKERLIGSVAHALIPAVIPGAALALGLVLLGKDLGTGLVMFAIVFGVLFFADVNWKALGLFLAGAASAVAFLVISSPNRMRRLLGLVGSGEDYSGHDWQPLHGLWALADGGIFGAGLGNSKAKWSWLPAADNDYIFAVIGEELGLVGAVVVILLYAILALALLRVMKIARDRFGRAVVGGVLIWIIGQAFINIGVVIRIFPVIGVPLPLISAGGTALISCLLAIGVVLSIARDGVQYRNEQAPKQRGMNMTRSASV